MKNNTLLMILTFAFLSACSNNKKIVTQDKSERYQNVKSMPALKKPTDQAVNMAVNNKGNAANIASPELITGSKGTILKFDAGFDATWNYLLNQIRGSDLTLHHHNEKAGKLSIGCNAVGEENNLSDLGKSAKRWFFNKRTDTFDDYCAIKVSSQKSSTLVAVINKNGFQVHTAQATALLKVLSK